MSSSVGAQDVNLEKLCSDVKGGKWSEVLKMCKQNRALCTEKITGAGDTVLHMVVCDGQECDVADMLNLVLQNRDEVESWNVNIVLGAENDKKNTPLHLAAEMGNVEMCKTIGRKDPSLIARRNIAGETPLFLTALCGRKEAFLWLHYLYRECREVSSTDLAHCIRDDKSTILHGAYAEGNFDVAIEIIHLYKDHLKEMMRRNKEHLSPLHLLAVNPSAFKTTALLKRSFLVHQIYGSLKVKEKNHATTYEELTGSIAENEKNRLVEHIAGVGFVLTLLLLYLLPLPVVTIFGPAYIWPTRVLVASLFLFVVSCVQSAIWLQSKFRNWIQGIRKIKEKHVLSLQILKILFQQDASNEDESVITSRTLFQHLLTCPEIVEDNVKQVGVSLMFLEGTTQGSVFSLNEKHNDEVTFGIFFPAQKLLGKLIAAQSSYFNSLNIETVAKIVDPPLMIAAKNGVIEMVKKILEFFPSGMNDLDDEGKNIVLLAAEKRQTKIYQFLRDCHKDNTAFRHVDKDGNTALHLAAKPGINLYGQTTTMIEEFKWFEFVKSSIPSELWGRYNKAGQTAEEVFRDSYKEHMKSDRKWLDQTSQTCTVASTIVAGMAFSNFAGDNFGRKNDASLVALSLSLTSTISFLAILAFRSQSLVFWKYVPFMIQIAILTMFGSIVALWISLIHGQSITTCAILGSPIAILTIVSLPIFIGPTVMSMFNPVPPLNQNTTNAIQYRRPQKKENEVDKDPKTTPNPTNIATDPIQDTARSLGDTFNQQKDEGGSASLISDILEKEAQPKDA